jgi:hypothetical protein
MDFHRVGGKWRYKTINETPGTMDVNDLHGVRKQLQRYEVGEAQEMLGIFITPNGSTDER